MKTLNLANHPYFLEKPPKKLEVKANIKKIILTNTLQKSDIHIRENGKLIFIAFLEKGWKEIPELNFHCECPESEVLFLALIHGKNNENFPFKTTSFHNAPNTKAHFLIRGALFDHSRVDYRGCIKIQSKAQFTDSHLSHHSLMLSENAKVTSLPSMEIENNNVTAGHEATMGKVDKEALFYLTTRGLNKKIAENILIQSFMETDLKEIRDEEIRNTLSQELKNSFKTQ